MIHIKCPENMSDFVDDGLPALTTTCFVAGGITNCPDWQTEFVCMMSDTNVVFFNPRRESFDITKSLSSKDQIAWEVEHLNRSEVVIFWFPEEGNCMISLFELGKTLGKGIPCIVGVEPGYIRALDVFYQLSMLSNQPMYKDLHSVADALHAYLGYKFNSSTHDAWSEEDFK